jgi:hypothetical protein
MRAQACTPPLIGLPQTSVGAHLRERDIFRHDGDRRFYLDFERDHEWVYRAPGNFWNWTRIGFR